MIAGLMATWNDEDIVASVVAHMLAECDIVLVTDNNSTDRTREILLANDSPRLTVRIEPEFTYCVPRMYAEMADMAREKGADWLIPCDSDEWWYVPGGRIRDMLPDAAGFTAGVYTFIPQPTDPPGDPFRVHSNRWPSLLSPYKVAFRADVQVDYSRHEVGAYDFAPVPVVIRHLPYRSLEGAKAKMRHALATLANQPQGVATHWRYLGALNDDDFAAWWASAVAGATVEDPL